MTRRSGFIKFNKLVLPGIILASAVVFFIDIQYRVGVVGDIPYVLLVMATYWSEQRRYTIAVGLLATLLISIGFLFSQSTEYFFLSAAIRIMSIVVIWGAVWFVINYKTSLARIRKDEERITALFEAAPEGIITSDLNGKIVLANKRAEELFGYPRGELIGEDIEVLVPQRYTSRHPEFRHEYYENLEPRPMGFGRDLYGVKKNGEEFPVEISLNHFETDEGKFIISYVIDITQRKEIEEQLRENEQRYRMLFQAATDEIMVFHVDENMEPLPFLEVNDVACDILGYAHDELLQKTLYDIMATDKEEVKKHIRNVIRFGKKLVELQHVTKRGKKIPLEISSRSFIYDGSQTIISIGRDIRERRKLEQEILNISEQERQRIGRDMHDDLGQLLTGVGLIAQNLANELRAEKAKGARKVQEISDLLKEADEHARALTRGLVPVNIESNGLDAALRDLTKRSAKMYDIDIHYNNNQDITLVDTSAVHLYRIAQEAINNAIKHGNATYIGVKLSTNNDHISLSVEDNGSGFPEIADTSDGMGVRIMNFRAQMMGGNLEIKSGHKDGTEIICKIPKNKS